MSCKSDAAALEVRDLAWGPDRGRPIISEVALAAAAGERIAIVGPNGAGKTTLLRCLYRAYRPDRGRVLVDGEDVWAVPARRVAQKMAVVLQEAPADFPFRVRDIVLLGRIPHRQGLASWSERDRRLAAHALEHLELQGMADRVFASLSGGEKQRVLVARALAQDPRIIVLDEPTNHLDIRHQLEILQLLKALRITIVTTLHDIDLAADFADRVALMAGGRVVAFGPPDQVLTAERISEVFAVRARRDPSRDGSGARFFFSIPARPVQAEAAE
ncbi:MAG: ABC transporter ATP-binding protein [Alphaproteobacteria bacterium]|nr:ABC transporter ATP-binding protein [Alphaproteobacteria bacterium]